MSEKQASSEIAQSRERFEKWLQGQPIPVATLDRISSGQYAVWDIEKLWRSWQAAERDTRQRCAQPLEEIIQHAHNWHANKLGSAAWQRRRWETLAQIALDGLERIRGKE